MNHIPRYLAPCSNPNHPLHWVQAMSTIAALTAERDALRDATRKWEKDFILYRKILADKTSQLHTLQSATRKVVEAVTRIGVFKSKRKGMCWCDAEHFYNAGHQLACLEIRRLLADPILVTLLRE